MGAQGMHCIEVPITGLQGQQLSVRCVLLLWVPWDTPHSCSTHDITAQQKHTLCIVRTAASSGDAGMPVHWEKTEDVTRN